MNFTQKLQVKGISKKSDLIFSSSDVVSVKPAFDRTCSCFASSIAVKAKTMRWQVYFKASMKTNTTIAFVYARKTNISIQHWDRSYPGIKKVR